MTNSLSRIKILDQNCLMAPGKCVLCGSVSGQFYDIGMDVDFYGVVYFCTTCFVQAANEFGYYSPNQVNNLRDQIAYYVEYNRELQVKVEAYGNALESLGIVRNLSISPEPGDPVVVEESATITVTESDPESGPDQSTTERKDGSSEQTNELRSRGLFDDDSLNEFLADNDI